MKKSKKIVSMAIAVLFVGSLGYFASLTPTGAWLYDEKAISESFDFGKFDVRNGKFVEEETLTFDATTKICDVDCVDDFDNAYEFGEDEGRGDRIVFQKDIDVTNVGNVSARLYVKVEPGVESGTARSDAGIRYFFYFVDSVSGESETAQPSNSDIIAGEFEKLGIPITKANLNECNKRYLTVEPGSQRMILRVLIWCDHDDIVDGFKNNKQNVAEFTTDAKIMLTAIQDSEDPSDNTPISEYYEDIDN